jgi:hypothetical protein
VGDHLLAGRHVDPVVTRVADRRRRDPQVHLGGALFQRNTFPFRIIQDLNVAVFGIVVAFCNLPALFQMIIIILLLAKIKCCMFQILC